MNSAPMVEFEPFPSVPGQHDAEWPARLSQISTHANFVSTGQQGGLLGYILPAAAYQARYGHAFQPADHPGQLPAANAAAGAWKIYEIQLANWKFESSAIQSLMRAIFKSLDAVSKSWFFDANLRNFEGI
jgi:hypothetical protein